MPDEHDRTSRQWVLSIVAIVGVCVSADLLADENTSSAQTTIAERPAILFNRWQEDWSVLADPRLRTEPFDDLKYWQLADDPHSYTSLGLNLRERFESVSAPAFGTAGHNSDGYLLQRFQFHIDIHPNANLQLFTQIEDARTVGKDQVGPVDENRLDLEQAFLALFGEVAGGNYKVRVGRQEFGFDLQRFVSVRDGPNVRQAFDALWLNWESGLWRVITFASQPVQYHNNQPFDDDSSSHHSYGGFRVERKGVGPGDLSAYYSRFHQDGAKYLTAAGTERRDIFDIRYAGAKRGIDWDLEAMTQSGEVGTADVRAWATGALFGYTFAAVTEAPRLGLQIDAASGNKHPSGNHLETFNPLFPNGYYFTLAGYTGYTNLIHLKPSLTLHPSTKLRLLIAEGFQWRQTTADAVYVQPNNPVPGTAGQAGRWTGAYTQLRTDYAITKNLSAAIEAVDFQAGDVIRRAGGRNGEYLGMELKYGW